VTDAGSDPGHGEELGGRSPLRVLLRVGRDVADAFAGLGAAVAAQTSGTIEVAVTVEPAATARDLLAELTTRAHDGPTDAPPDIAVLSSANDIDGWAASPTASGADAAEAWREAMRSICAHYKARGTRVFVCNASTVVPDDHRSQHHDVPESTSVFANRLDAALIELSIDEGISILDVDGLVARLGAEEHVCGLASYTDAALEVIGDELVRIIDDYGFFHPRPLLPQRGRGAA
jgi:hypothetical protein